MRLTSYTISSMTGITPVGERRQVTLAPVERAASSSRLRCDSKSRVTQTSDSPRRSRRSIISRWDGWISLGGSLALLQLCQMYG